MAGFMFLIGERGRCLRGRVSGTLSLMTPAEFWAPWEGVALADFLTVDTFVRSLGERFPGRTFAWRGVVNAEWALHSSLYRRLLWTLRKASPSAQPPGEIELKDYEAVITRDARRWGLHSGPRGRLSFLEFLATLQHFKAPTRLIDVTFNPYMALFFAVEASSVHDATDGRLFAIDVTERLINDHEDPTLREWEHKFEPPWAGGAQDWTSAAYAWRPAGFDRRIAAQHGGFLLAGVPDTTAGQWPKEPTATAARWTIHETREAVSVPLRVHKVDSRTRTPDQPSYTVRVAAAAKPAIRRVLENTFSLNYASVYPDVAGFAEYGTPQLRREP